MKYFFICLLVSSSFCLLAQENKIRGKVFLPLIKKKVSIKRGSNYRNRLKRKTRNDTLSYQDLLARVVVSVKPLSIKPTLGKKTFVLNQKDKTFFPNVLAVSKHMKNLTYNHHYQQLLADVKQRIQQAQAKVAIAANQELLLLYWEKGTLILERQAKEGWGAKIREQLSKDLKKAFPDMRGFSKRNLLYMKQFSEAYPNFEITQVPLAQISWYHNITLLQKCPEEQIRFWYAQQALENGWSRDVMVHQIELGLYERQGQAITNFAKILPSPQSEIAQKLLKDPYILDFLNLRQDVLERELEDAIVKHITQFLLELGKGFAFVGRQYYLEVGGDEFFIDLLFYHLELRCYVAIDLKMGKFKPENVGKMNFYLSVMDDTVKKAYDAPSIGIILCKSKNKVTAEYALRNINRPIGISEYELTKAIPKHLQSQLPTIEDLERELKEIEIKDKERE